MRSYVAHQVLGPAQHFIHTEAGGGAVLLVAATTALMWANSPWAASYHRLWQTVITLDLGVLVISKGLAHWINDGLMAIFFFVVGLEIKREVVHGHLADRRRAALPLFAALGGMAAPVLFFLLFNLGGAGERGWGIPMATDIAFALGVLALLGTGIPAQLRVFLLALAIVDDIGSILVIAVFYTESLSLTALAAAAALVGLILLLRRQGVRNVNIYILLGVCFWVALLKSGIHATLAGVVLGLLTPAQPYFERRSFVESAQGLIDRFQSALARSQQGQAEAMLSEFETLSRGTESPLERIERRVHPWSSYLILPVFALANSGVTVSGDLLSRALTSPVTLGIALGLVAGKIVGVFSFSWIPVKLGMATLPARVSWLHILGAGMLAGIGFTVSLFIAGLAYSDPVLSEDAKIGILAASLLAGAVGYAFMALIKRRA